MRLQSNLTALALALILIAAARTAGAEERGLTKTLVAWDGEPIELSVKAVSKVGRLTREVEDLAMLRSGDYLSFAVTVSQPAFVYVIQLHPDQAGGLPGDKEVLYPEQGDLWLEAGVATRIPEAPYWYQLDDVTGVENIVFVASARPLAAVDRAIYDEVETIRVAAAGAGPASATATAPQEAAPAAPPPAAPPPATTDQAARESRPPASPGIDRPRPAPKATTLATRGLVKAAVSGDPTLRIESDDQGIAILHFRVHHEARQRP